MRVRPGCVVLCCCVVCVCAAPHVADCDFGHKSGTALERRHRGPDLHRAALCVCWWEPAVCPERSFSPLLSR